MKLKIILALLIALTMAFAGCTTVPPGYVGIVVDLTGGERGVQDYTIQTGRVFYNPFTQDVLSFPTSIQTSAWTQSPYEGSPNNEEIEFNDKDGLKISSDISYSYFLERDKVPYFYVKFRTDNIEDFTDGFARNKVREAFNSVGSKLSVEEILGKKEEMIRQVKDLVNEDLKEYGVVFEQLGYIGSIRPPKSIIDRINSKIEATQLAIQTENEVRQAEAEAKKLIAKAKGIADSTVASKRGEAEGNRLLSASITPNLIKWRELENTANAIEAWKQGGKVPSTFITGSNAGMIYQLLQDGK